MNSLSLSTSPKSLFDFFGDRSQRKPLSLNELIQQLPSTIESILEFQDSVKPRDDGSSDRIAELLGRLDVSDKELSKFAHFDDSKNYTRNLVATDDKHYCLLVLCWNPGKASPIHDHPCDGCWMQVLQGTVQECRYQPKDDGLECISDQLYQDGQVAYIHDYMGYHKVGNPSKSQPAVTLHLYCPPISKCRIFLDPTSCQSSSSSVCYHSKYGHVSKKERKL